MRHSYWISALAALLLSTSAMAHEMDKDKGHKFEPAKTRQEAITRAEERVAKLKGMSDKEWADKRESRRAHRKGDKEAPAAGTPAEATPEKK